MSTSAALIEELGWDEKRGTAAMGLFITTEAMLFVALFFSYFYLSRGQPRWPLDEPPKLMYASIMLVTLLVSSGVLFLAERLVKEGRKFIARWLVGLTVLLGVGFIVLQVLEYRDHLARLKPTDDSYASIFYTITSVHGAHVVLGLLMLCYALLLPQWEPAEKPPHRPLHNAALYWHFVDAAWVVIVSLLYYLPHFVRGAS